jgi:hypothetical protein
MWERLEPLTNPAGHPTKSLDSDASAAPHCPRALLQSIAEVGNGGSGGGRREERQRQWSRGFSAKSRIAIINRDPNQGVF